MFTSFEPRKINPHVVLLLMIAFLFVALMIDHCLDNEEYGELVFSRNLQNHGVVYTINSDGSGSTDLTNIGASLSLENLYLAWHRFKILNYKSLPPLFDSSSDLDAQWSPDATRVAYRSYSGYAASIYLLQANHRNKRRLTHNIDVHHFAWLEKNKILIEATDNQVYLLNTDSTHITPIECLTNGFIDVSPDGSQVIAVNEPSVEFFGGFTQLVVVDLNCLRTTVIAEHDPGICTASWSPTRDEILFVTWNEVNTAFHNGTPIYSYICNQVYRVNIDGSSQVRLDKNDYSSKNQLAWSPDGAQIAFTASVNDIQDMFIMNRDGSNLIQLTNSPAYEEYPVWSPGGDYLAFGYIDHIGKQSSIFIYDVDDSTLNSVAVNQYGGGSISWRP